MLFMVIRSTYHLVNRTARGTASGFERNERILDILALNFTGFDNLVSVQGDTMRLTR